MGFSYKYTRYSAIAQILLGGLLVIFGMADRAKIYYYEAFEEYDNRHRTRTADHSLPALPVWMGIWAVITGVIGFFATSRKYANQDNRSSTPLIGVFLGFSTASLIFSVTTIAIYIIGVSYLQYHCDIQYYIDSKNVRYLDAFASVRRCKTSLALGLLVIIFAFLEAGFAIMACVCCYMNGCPCWTDCCNECFTCIRQLIQHDRAIYIQCPHCSTHVANQSSDGVPVSVPVPTTVVAPSQAQAVPVTQVVNPPTFSDDAVDYRDVMPLLVQLEK